jgi:uncharacterized membrane protein
MDMGQLIFVILMAISLSACAGLRAFIAPLALSLFAMTGHITLSPQFSWLARWEVAAIFGLAVVIEIIADKYPGVDHALDAAALVIKPAMGALVASSVITGVDPLLALILGIILGGGTAGVVHVGRAKLRLLSTAFTGGLGNPLLSVAEDGVAIVWAAVMPWVYVVTGLLVVVLVVWLLSRVLPHSRRAPSVEIEG